MGESLTIGILAKRGGVNVETIRYYQRRALLEEPLKPSGGFRR
jgi:MerR family transcriptional regulator, mercuric resistance operon regulatory protein